MRRIALFALGAVVLIVAGGVFFALQGGDAPPPPKLSRRGVVTAAEGLTYRVGNGSFAGYRVDEDYLGVGVHTAVGRTRAVTGVVRLDRTRVTSARIVADMTQLHSDQARRDDTLRRRGIETDRYPRAAFTLTAPFAVSAREQPAAGTLELHGRRAPVKAMLTGSLGERLELVGHVFVDFKRFGIEPPSVAGLVTVESTGLLEFRILAYPG